ncbi:hypothetical protein EMIHUDRAFT_236664 [Emiliania huxleyi CCMP1516]|uniref:FAD-binding domain-containing protein n=2 Tax=Emiliania huxleyi TaxID=2903 RepID=A0A0D3JSZ2_EMIH1|nr:hypothetical protein EMIHUDRAFT_236664 [Emiliania huxleyi CCMP1516]EOD26627.1 hypothetical protein EMIHUDRAFT_236664 [Emiliania huxleyi CCMP1516]|eukprot:XP_005779056.1 hypothetical protein EMIHUDRAFT_236664 [Emiliania huxleyi CCMP1516]
MRLLAVLPMCWARSVQHVDIAIIGGGPCGLATALALRRVSCLKDASIAVFERDHMEPKGAAIAIQPMGIDALNDIDIMLVPEMRRRAVRMSDLAHLSVNDLSSDSNEDGFPRGFCQPYRQRPIRERLWKWLARVGCRLRIRPTRSSFNWHDVRSVLAKQVHAICGPETLRFGHTLMAVRTRTASEGIDLTFGVESADDRHSVTYRARLVCSADGVRSMTRRCWPGADTATAKPQGKSVWYGLAPRLRLGDRMIRVVAHKSCLLNVQPAFGGRGTSFSFMAPAVSGYAIDDFDAARRLLSAAPRKLRSTLTALIKATPHVTENKLHSRDFSRPWASPSHRLCFLGDAAHPMRPTFGYGTSLGFEDAVVLARIAKREGSLDSFVANGVRAFERARLSRVRAVVEISHEAALSYYGHPDEEAAARGRQHEEYRIKLLEALAEHPIHCEEVGLRTRCERDSK